MVKGKELRDAHYKLGTTIAPYIYNKINSDRLNVIVLLRAGLCFANGIADGIEKMGKIVSILFQSDDQGFSKQETSDYLVNSETVIVDAVINSGKSIIELVQKIKNPKQIIIATAVIQEEAIEKFNTHNLFAVRSSKNKYVGDKIDVVRDGKGPDTGDRLFNTM
jgi:uracil phosphoribosyltransferase